MNRWGGGPGCRHAECGGGDRGVRSGCVAALAVAGMMFTQESAAAAGRPNFLLILADDHGWSQMSAAMDPEILESRSEYLETPGLDRLAREGIRFTSGYAPAPLCTPTRRSILCGTTAARSGPEFSSSWVPAEHPTIPRFLKQADAAYRCAHFGKWGEQMISTPEECGYDSSDGMTGNVTGGMPSTFGEKSHSSGPANFIDNEDPKLTATVTEHAIAFMREQAGAGHPFYVQASYYAVHLSVVCRETTLAKYEAKGAPDRGYSKAWAAMLEEMDEGVGRLLDALDELGLADNTYVFFLADNGGRGTVPGGDESRLPTNVPLTGAKHSLYEGGIRVPFLARGPGLKAGAVCRVPVAGYDFLPTFYDLAGGLGPVPPAVDGVSLRPLLENPVRGEIARPGNALYFHRPARLFSAIRKDGHKLMLHWNPDGSVASRELFRLEPDPREEGRDIADADPATADRLQTLLVDYLESVGADKPAPRPRKPGAAPRAAN